MLETPLHVSAVAPGSMGLVAVGGAERNPAVWTLQISDAAWELTASAPGFPEGTTLQAVTAFGRSILAAGSVSILERERVIRDANDQPVIESVYRMQPAIFLSPDGHSWDQVLLGDSVGADVSGLAVSSGGTEVIAIGSRLPEPGVGQAAGVLAWASRDGRSWTTPADIDFPTTGHGGITLFTNVEERLLLAGWGVDGASFLAVSKDGRTWATLAPPTGAYNSLLAAVGVSGRVLLAGMDDLGRPRWWIGDGSGVWVDLDPPPLSGSARAVWMTGPIWGSVPTASRRSDVSRIEAFKLEV